MRRSIHASALLLSCLASVVWLRSAAGDDAAVARKLADAFDRTSSIVTVHILPRTDRAAVEFAAYDRNPVFYAPIKNELSAPAGGVALSDLDFGGALVPGSVVDTLGQIPLSKTEVDQACAWPGLAKRLMEWDWDAAEPVLLAANAIQKQKWGNDQIPVPIAQPLTAYLHGDEMWLKVEFHPKAAFIEADDEDGDGYREVYGRVDMGATGEKVRAWIRDQYLGVPLDAEGIESCLFELASDWYATHQTVVLEPELTRPWPNDETEPEVRAAVGDEAFQNALGILRSSPYGVPIYNVFLLPEATAGLPPLNAPDEPAAHPWAAEPQRWGGSYAAWAERLAPFRAAVTALLDSQPEEVKGLAGPDGFLFFRGDLEYLLADDLRQQAGERDPYPAIVDFAEQLRARGIDLLVVFIPTKAEVYPERVTPDAPAGAEPYVQPYCRKLMAELAEAGVGVVDLLPAFIAAREGEEPLYQAHDTHWTNRGARLAAAVLAEHVREFGWLPTLSPQPHAYRTQPATFTRRGDIVPMLPVEDQLTYRPQELTAEQVIGPDGALYENDPDSPIVMLGDSFTGVFELEDCKHAGLSAHLAKELGVPIDLIMAQGSGPTIRGRLARRGADAINAKKLVIWTVVSRDLYNYWSPWKPIPLPN